ncbi:MAG: indolepyruvate ferredoxin oxidoreductase family protein [Betaproteobacteria bacterium]|nr:indolepyruvate ferredoxin oxidoreductase family protein [Betaproteobacteria bacterium]
MHRTAPLVGIDHSYQLSHQLTREQGRVFLSGTQALVRLVLEQRRLDRARGLKTAGFVSGYRGSPLGGVDQALWAAQSLLDAHDIRFLPAINEELGASAVVGAQRAGVDPRRTVEGVFAMWYGKGPGVDRAADAIHHGNAFGSSPQGGVLVVAGDDHGCVSSSMPHQSDGVFQAWSVPVLNPSTIAEILEFGLYGWALSRFSGAWVGLKAISETVESGATVDLDRLRRDWTAAADFEPPEGGLHIRMSDLPGLAFETRLAAKLDAVRAFAKNNSIDRLLLPAPQADLGIVTCGKGHLDLLEVLRRLGLSLAELEAAGLRLYKIGLTFPIEPSRLLEFAQGLQEILVVEEKAPILETQIKDLLYNLPAERRPRVVGKHGVLGRPMIATLGELRPSRIMPDFAEWLARAKPALDRRDRVADFTAPVLLSNEGDAVRRMPYFCSGCPHNTSTRVPEGSRALPGIGCHYMATWMNRETSGMTQMGGEGVDWVGQAMFSSCGHVFQNLGDGTYSHSGLLAIRQAIAAKAHLTYKVLYNDAVAMTGGQPVEGRLSVRDIARQVEAEGASRVVVVSDEPEKYRGRDQDFPAGTSFHHRRELDRVQRELRETPGVTVLIYDQTCAAEKRRRRKRGEFPDPDRRVFINARVCEGCGDCAKQSNCLSVLPLETEFGRKRMIDQSSCNKDYSCVEGFCPSFVSVQGVRLKKALGASFDPTRLKEAAEALPPPPVWRWTGPFDLLVAGMGGTGVVTIGALVTMAAHLEGKHASVLDFMGFSQKGGAVLSHVRLADRAEWLNQARIDTQQADAILACDLVVGASTEALQTASKKRTQIITSTYQAPTPAVLQDPDAQIHAEALLAKMRFAVREDAFATCDGHTLSTRFLGDAIGANMVMLGFAWQRGLVPVSDVALDRAVELNGVAVEMNRQAIAIGRLAAAHPAALTELLGDPAAAEVPEGARAELDAYIARRVAELTAYQNAAWGARYASAVERVRAAEGAAGSAEFPLTRAVAFNLHKLMAYKDEYEVARLFTAPEFLASLAAQFEGEARLSFHLAPPLLGLKDHEGRPRKLRFGSWMLGAMRLLARLKGLRGTWFDPFGHSAERKRERALIAEYESLIDTLLARYETAKLPTLLELAGLPEHIRGFGHIKAQNLAAAARRRDELLARLDAPDAPTAVAPEVPERAAA